jgi:hypothetical protein
MNFAYDEVPARVYPQLSNIGYSVLHQSCMAGIMSKTANAREALKYMSPAP